MSRKLLIAMLVALGALAWSVDLVHEPWWMRLFGLHRPAPEAAGPVWTLSLLGGGVELEARLGGPLFLPERDEIVPLRVALVGRGAAVEQRRRLPLNIALLVDRSGSMQEDSRMQQVKHTLDLLIERLQSQDSVAVVSFGTGVSVHRQAGERLDRQILREQVRSMRPGGGTNLSAGLEEACRQVQSQLRPGINRILLFSDGIANIGLRDPAEIVGQLASCLGRGVTVSTIGVGADFNEDLLAELAERGRGNYYFAERSSEIAGALARELEELGSVVAQAPVLRLELPDGVELARLYGYEHRSEGRAIVIPMKDLYAGEQRKLLAELRVRPAAAETTPVVKPILAWTGTDQARRSLAAARALCVARAKDASEAKAHQDPQVAAEVVYTRNSLALEEASALVSSGRNVEAEQRIREALAQTRSERASSGQPKVQKQLAEMETSLEWVRGADAEPKQRVAAKRMKAKARDYKKQ
jgi:Ca-activated chloride channel family protein